MKTTGLCCLILYWVCEFCSLLAFSYFEVTVDIYDWRDVVIVAFNL